MYFTKQLDTNHDLSHQVVWYFSPGFHWGPGPLYVPTAEEINAAVAEYQMILLRAPELADPELDKALSDPEVARQALLTEVNSQADKFEQSLNKDMYFTSSLGFKVNGDRRTKENLSDLINYGPETGVQYRDYENQLQLLSRSQLQQILAEHITNGQNLYQQKWALQQLINSSQGFDGLHEIVVQFTMMDFTQPGVKSL